MEYLREKIIKLRKSHHLTQGQVAAELHIRKNTYSHYETGRIIPPLSSLIQLAKLYHVSLEEFVDRTELSDEESVEIEKDIDDLVVLMHLYKKLDEGQKEEFRKYVERG